MFPAIQYLPFVGFMAYANFAAPGILPTRRTPRMAENKEQPKDDLLLVAEVRAHLLDGETVDLLPFKHGEDVRAEVNKFIEDWARTGFLLKANQLYPWHRVKSIQVVLVKLLTHAQAESYLENWRQDSEAQQAFWKTRKPQKEEKKESSPAPAH
jgi:hypothetical protein